MSEDTALVTQNQIGAVERVLIGGDLGQLSENERLAYYKATCESLGLNPLTKPFDYIELNGKLTLYAKRDCTDQLRKLHNISVKIVGREVVDGVCVVTSQAKTPEGREDESVGAVPLVKDGGSWRTNQGGKRFFEADGTLIPLRPEDRANAIMKAETKSKRRVTLSICGLGMLDESEFDTISGKIEKPIDTGGHAPGTQAAADYVAEKKIEKQKAEAGMPKDLARMLDSIKKPQNAYPLLKIMMEQLEAALPLNGGEEYERLGAKHGLTIDGEINMKATVDQFKAAITDMYATVHAVAELKKEGQQ